MFRWPLIMTSIVFLQACVPYFTTHWPEDIPEFAQDRRTCSDQILQAHGESDEAKIEDCLVEKGWSKEREWDVVFIPIGGIAGM